MKVQPSAFWCPFLTSVAEGRAENQGEADRLGQYYLAPGLTHDDQQLAAIFPGLVLEGFPPTSPWKQLFVEGKSAELLGLSVLLY